MIFHDGDIRKLCVQWFCLWYKISKRMKDYQDVLETFKFFTKKVFPGCPRDVSFNVFEGFGQYSFFYSKQILCVIITVTKCLQTMSFPELQASYYSEPYEWITAKKNQGICLQ